MFNKARLVFILISLLMFTCLLYSGQTDISGHWEGRIDLPGNKLEINVDFQKDDDGAVTGDISIPMQNAENLPLKDLSIIDDDILFIIEGIPGEPSFRGKISQDNARISGMFTQDGAEFSFVLERADEKLNKARKVLRDFGEIVNTGLNELKVPGASIAVVMENEIIFEGGFGYRDLEEKKPMTVDTILAIGSCTKAFTTFTLAKLVETGRLEWDKPLRNYIPWFALYDKMAGERLTPRDLVTHRSGLPRHDFLWYNNHTITREELVRRLAYLPHTADLREKFQYNNLMYLTAGYLTEVLTESSWEEAVSNVILSPLGMERTNFSVIKSQADDDFAYPYTLHKNEIKRIPFRDISIIGPAGSINSSVREMTRWAMVHLNRGRYGDMQILSGSLLKDIHTQHMTTGRLSTSQYYTASDYALGWMVDTYRGYRRVYHGGNIDGFSALVSLVPDKGIGIVVLANSDSTSLGELLARTVLDRLFELEPVDWIGDTARKIEEGEKIEEESERNKYLRRKQKTKPSHNILDYEGVYNHPGYGDIIISADQTHLSFTFNDITTPLEHWHYNTFNALEAEDPTFKDRKLTFITTADGNLGELRVFMEPTLDKEIVFYKQPDEKFLDPEYLSLIAGEYELASTIMEVFLIGNRLMLNIPGQPAYELVPKIGGEFFLKQAPAVLIWFQENDKGEITIMNLNQFGEIYELKRVSEMTPE